MYGGGRRRRSSGSSGWGIVIGALLALAALFYAVMWPLSLWGHLIHLTPSFHQLMHRDHGWEHEHYPLVGLRYVGAAVLLLLLAVLLIVLVVALGDRSKPAQASPRTVNHPEQSQ